MPLVALDRVSIAFGHLPLLDAASLQIDPGERIAVLGRNGTGKSTLLQIISGETQPDSGSVWRQPSVRVARLVQDVPLTDTRTVAAVVAEGVSDDHHKEEWLRDHQVDLILTRLGLSGETLGRHAFRRMAAARAACASARGGA